MPTGIAPFAGGGLTAHADYDSVHFPVLDFAGQIADDATFFGCRLERCGMDGVRMRRARLSECWLDEIHATSVDAADSTWRDTLVSVRRVGALLLAGASLSSVRVRGGRLDLVDLSGARLRGVAFDGCAIGELDLGAAEGRDLSFEGCEVELLDVTGARLSAADFTRATIGAVKGVDGLRGAVITPGQLVDIAPLLAAHLGLKVREVGEDQGSRPR